MPKLSEKKSAKPKKAAESGWAAVAKRKSQNDSVPTDKVWDFYLGSGETAVVQFIDDDPYCFDAHQIKDAKGKWRTLACQLSTQEYCLMCEDNSKLTWKAAFKVLDFRGTWDKDRKRFTNDKPVLKIWKCSNTLALQIQSLIEKRGVPLSEQVFEVTRTGSGAKDTSYNFQPAFDEKTERKLKPIDFEDESPATKELCRPLPDTILEKMGFGDMDSDED